MDVQTAPDLLEIAAKRQLAIAISISISSSILDYDCDYDFDFAERKGRWLADLVEHWRSVRAWHNVHGLFLKRHFGGFHHEDSKNTKILVIGRWE